MSENSFSAESGYCATLDNRISQVTLGHKTVLYYSSSNMLQHMWKFNRSHIVLQQYFRVDNVSHLLNSFFHLACIKTEHYTCDRMD